MKPVTLTPEPHTADRRQIGAGAVGCVYEGTWRRSRVAVKRLLTKTSTWQSETKTVRRARGHGVSPARRPRVCAVRPALLISHVVCSYSRSQFMQPSKSLTAQT